MSDLTQRGLKIGVERIEELTGKTITRAVLHKTGHQGNATWIGFWFSDGTSACISFYDTDGGWESPIEKEPKGEDDEF